MAFFDKITWTSFFAWIAIVIAVVQGLAWSITNWVPEAKQLNLSPLAFALVIAVAAILVVKIIIRDFSFSKAELFVLLLVVATVAVSLYYIPQLFPEGLFNKVTFRDTMSFLPFG